jgi:hypothetical protein
MEQSELEVVMDQLDEMLGSAIVDADDAMEVAALAGLAVRLGGTGGSLDEALIWRQGPGGPLLQDAWLIIDFDDFLGPIDDCTSGGATEAQVEEAIFDFDEIVAAAVWCGVSSKVRDAAVRVENMVRLVPDVFADMACYGSALAAMPDVAAHFDVYGYWLALAEAGAYADADWT